MTLTTKQSTRLDVARHLERRWAAQQTAYIRHRSERFATIARVVSEVCADVERPRVLDLAGGTGSLGAVVLAETPSAEVVVVDKDPLLLAIAEDLIPDRPGSVVACLDLADPEWLDDPRVAGSPYDAVVSSTALHWLQPEVLVSVYRALAGIVRPGGVVLNGDHLAYDEHTEPTMRRLAAKDDKQAQQEALTRGADTWKDWWAAAEAVPHYSDAVARRRTTWGAELHTAPPKVTLGFHLETLRSAGFSETGVVWRYLDDHVLYAVL